MFAEPLLGYRQATARARRTKVDWALEVAHLLDTRYAHCDVVTLVMDNLNTHTGDRVSLCRQVSALCLRLGHLQSNRRAEDS